MDALIKEYRTKHKKCKWCKYCKFHSNYTIYGVPDYYTCELKDKIIFENILRLCKYYRLKEEKNEISIIKTNEPKI